MWRFLDERFEDILGAILLAVMAAVAFINVVVRYCTSFSFAWTEELTVNFFVWVVLLGTARSFRDGSNLCMSMLYDACPHKLQFLFRLVGTIVCIIFFASLVWTGYLEVLDEIELEATSEALELPVWYYTCATPILSLLVIFRILQNFVSSFKKDGEK